MPVAVLCTESNEPAGETGTAAGTVTFLQPSKREFVP